MTRLYKIRESHGETGRQAGPKPRVFNHYRLLETKSDFEIGPKSFGCEAQNNKDNQGSVLRSAFVVLSTVSTLGTSSDVKHMYEVSSVYQAEKKS